MKVGHVFVFIVLIANTVFADNNILINNYEREVINFETSFLEFYSGTTSENSQWQYYANNAINLHREMNRIFINDRNEFTIAQIDRISKLNDRFESAFLITEQVNRIELSQNNFHSIIARSLLNITNVDMRSVFYAKEELQQYISTLIEVIQLIPFTVNEEQTVKTANLLARQVQMSTILNAILEMLNSEVHD